MRNPANPKLQKLNEAALRKSGNIPEKSEQLAKSLQKIRKLAKRVAMLKRQRDMLAKLLENWPRRKKQDATTGQN
jgi:hypothetical protein